MLNFLRPIVSRIIGSLVAAVALYLSSKLGIVLDDNAQEQIIAGGVAVALALFQIVYAIAHRVIDKRVNPGDAASSHLAVAEKSETATLKARAGA